MKTVNSERTKFTATLTWREKKNKKKNKIRLGAKGSGRNNVNIVLFLATKQQNR